MIPFFQANLLDFSSKTLVGCDGLVDQLKVLETPTMCIFFESLRQDEKSIFLVFDVSVDGIVT